MIKSTSVPPYVAQLGGMRTDLDRNYKFPIHVLMQPYVCLVCIAPHIKVLISINPLAKMVTHCGISLGGSTHINCFIAAQVKLIKTHLKQTNMNWT